MTQREIKEMLLLKDWDRDHLAGLLKTSRNTIDRWFCKDEKHRRYPSEQHVTKMRKWLMEARKDAYATQTA